MAHKVVPDCPQGTCSTYGTENTEDQNRRHGRITISVCSSMKEDSVSGFLQYLRTLKDKRQDLIEDVEFHPLPYNDIDKHKFPKDTKLNVMLLCHSIHNRRFAITDVTDALYTKYLRRCKKKLGKERVAVIVHDFDDFDDGAEKRRMASFRQQQPTTFKLAALTFTAGRLDGSRAEISEKNFENLEQFLQHAAAPRNSNGSQASLFCLKVR